MFLLSRCISYVLPTYFLNVTMRLLWLHDFLCFIGKWLMSVMCNHGTYCESCLKWWFALSRLLSESEDSFLFRHSDFPCLSRWAQNHFIPEHHTVILLPPFCRHQRIPMPPLAVLPHRLSILRGDSSCWIGSARDLGRSVPIEYVGFNVNSEYLVEKM